MKTPHISAEPGDFAPVVVMPGDPLRSRYIAENYLTDARLVNDVRGVQGYTGYYFGTRVSVMASGMGMPSMGIYAHELFGVFGVRGIVRAGSTGAYSTGLKLRDIVIALTAATDSNCVEYYGAERYERIPASERLTAMARKSSAERNLRAVGGGVYTSDVFYAEPSRADEWKARGAIAVEMETAMLYAVARHFGRDALALCTVSDYALEDASRADEALDAEARERGFDEMITLALDTAARASESFGAD